MYKINIVLLELDKETTYLGTDIYLASDIQPVGHGLAPLLATGIY